MKNRVLFLIALVLSSGVASANSSLSSTTDYIKTGEYVRRYLGTPLYTISFFTDPAKITPGSDSPSYVILNPVNDIPYRIEIVTHTQLKNYGMESRSLRRTLEKAGVKVDRKWNIISGTVRQQDLFDYVDVVVGRSNRNHGEIYRRRKPGDVVRLTVENGTGQIEYFPHETPQHAEISLKTREPDLIRGIVSTYIDTGRSLDEIQDMPAALLGCLLSDGTMADIRK